MKFKCWWTFFHDWADWERYEVWVTGYISHRPTCIKTRQRRSCNKCGRWQDKHVSRVDIV